MNKYDSQLAQPHHPSFLAKNNVGEYASFRETMELSFAERHTVAIATLSALALVGSLLYNKADQPSWQDVMHHGSAVEEIEYIK